MDASDLAKFAARAISFIVEDLRKQAGFRGVGPLPANKPLILLTGQSAPICMRQGSEYLRARIRELQLTLSSHLLPLLREEHAVDLEFHYPCVGDIYGDTGLFRWRLLGDIAVEEPQVCECFHPRITYVGAPNKCPLCEAKQTILNLDTENDALNHRLASVLERIDG